jgi:hypothetical protein
MAAYNSNQSPARKGHDCAHSHAAQKHGDQNDHWQIATHSEYSALRVRISPLILAADRQQRASAPVPKTGYCPTTALLKVERLY